jgi:hypothetical protein
MNNRNNKNTNARGRDLHGGIDAVVGVLGGLALVVALATGLFAPDLQGRLWNLGFWSVVVAAACACWFAGRLR